MKNIRWAVVGTGYIANQFAKGMQEVEDAILAAVVSRNMESGRKYAEKYHGRSVYTDFQEMLDMEEIDVVYIAIPNNCHYSYIMEALDKGVAVLSEKPMVDNHRQLEKVLAKAKEKNVFLMEGMWTRCFPAVRQARKWIEEGRIGNPLEVHAAFNIKPAMEDWQPWKGGILHAAGALRDVGIYSLAMADMVFHKKPDNVSSVMKSNGEVDESFHMLMDYGEGKAAFLGGAFNHVSTPVTEIVGENGRILIGPEFWHPTTATMIMNDGTTEEFFEEYPATGFQFEIRQVQECLKEGRLECPLFTLEETVRIADLIEKTRKEWGIIYLADNIGDEMI